MALTLLPRGRWDDMQPASKRPRRRADTDCLFTARANQSRRTGICAKSLSQHLASLRTAGLIYATRRGQHGEYKINPARVVCQLDETTGRDQLQVFAAGESGVSVTITVGGFGANERESGKVDTPE